MAGPTLGEAVVEVGADTDPLMADAERDGREAGDRAGNAFADEFIRDANGRLRDNRGRLVGEGEESGRRFGLGFFKGFIGGGGGNKQITTFGQLGFSFAQAALKGGLFLSTITPLPTALVGVVAGAVAVTGAVGLAAGSMLSAATAASSLGLALVGLKVGMSGVADAWKLQQKAMEEMRVEGKVSESTQKQLDAAMKRLAPSARAVVKELRQMAPAWGKMRKEVQGNLFSGFAPILERIGKSMLPIVRDGLIETTSILNTAGKAVGNFFASAEGGKTMEVILTGLNNVLRTVLPALGNITRGLLTLFVGSLPQAQSMSNTLLGLTKRFREWAAAITESGRFQDFLQRASEAASALFGVVGGLGRVLATVFGAGSDEGVSMLQTFDKALERFDAFLNSAKGQNALESFFDTISVAAQTASDLFSVFSPIVSGIADVIGALTPAFDSLRATMLPIAQKIGAKLGKGLGEIASLVTGQLVPAFRDMLPVLAPVASFLLGIFSGAVIGAIKGFVTILTGAFQIITGVFNVFKALFTGNWSLLWSSLGLILQGAWNLIKGIIQVAFNIGILGLFRKGIAVLRGLWTGFWAFVRAIPGATMSFIRGVISGAWGTIRGIFSGAGGAIRVILSGLWGAVRSLASRGMSGFLSVVRSVGGRVISFFKELPGKFMDKLRSLAGDLKKIGSQAMTGLWNGLKAGASKVWDKAKDIANGVKDRLAGALKIFSPSRVMMDMGEMVTKGLALGIGAGEGHLAKAMAGIANTVIGGVQPAVTRMPATIPNGLAPRPAADPTLRLPNDLGQMTDTQMRRQAKYNAEELAKHPLRLDRQGNIRLMAMGGI